MPSLVDYFRKVIVKLHQSTGDEPDAPMQSRKSPGEELTIPSDLARASSLAETSLMASPSAASMGHNTSHHHHHHDHHDDDHSKKKSVNVETAFKGLVQYFKVCSYDVMQL